MLQLSLSDIRCDFSPAAITALQVEFRDFHTFQVRQFLAPEFFDFLMKGLPDKDFKPRPHGKIAMELAVDGKANVAIHCLQLRMNEKRLSAFIRTVTGIETLKHFSGRIYRMLPGGEHYDSWHDDVSDGRQVGISINLSPLPYSGGTFILKDGASGEIKRIMPNLGPGDAIFFRISEGLQHMVTKVEGATPKTAFAGWFHDHDSLTEMMQRSSLLAAQP